MKTTLRSVFIISTLTASALFANHTVNKPTLTLEGAKRAGDAAEAFAAKVAAPGGAIVVVDDGLTLEAQGRLTIAEHGNRRITRLEKNGVLTVLADRFEGKRLNSPNNLV